MTNYCITVALKISTNSLFNFRFDVKHFCSDQFTPTLIWKLFVVEISLHTA